VGGIIERSCPLEARARGLGEERDECHWVTVRRL
jgi:hypothetical protein